MTSSGSPATGTRARIAGWLASDRTHSVLITAVATAFVVVAFSTAVLPRLESRCGRLVRVPAGFDSLTMNLVRLATPPGTSWDRVEARYRLLPGEALSFVLDRRVDGGDSPEQVGRDFQVVRLSRIDSMPSAVLTFSDDTVRSSVPLSLEAAPGILEGTVSIERTSSGTVLDLGAGKPIQIPASAAPGRFEVALFPPSSTELHERVQLGLVRLANGQDLPLRKLAEVGGSPWFQGGVVVAFAALLRSRLRARSGRWFPFQHAHSPAAITSWLMCALAIVGWVALIPHFELLHSFSVKERAVYRIFLTIVLGSSYGFMRLRDRFLARFPRAISRRFFHPALLPLQLVVASACVVMVVVAVGSLQVRFEPQEELARTEPGARVRIAVVGGSQTRGFPFIEGWKGAFPERLESLLRSRGVDSVAVWNLGVDAAGLDHIREHLPRRVEVLAPTHLIVNSVVNSAPFGLSDVYREALERFLAVAEPRVPNILLVEEPDLEPLYQAGKWPSVSPLYPVLEEVATRHHLQVIDPKPTLVSHRQEFLFMDDIHFTPHGHRIMAEVLAAAIAPALSRDPADPPRDTAPAREDSGMLTGSP